MWSRDSSVDIVAGYVQGGRGSIPGWGRIFLYSSASTMDLGPTQAAIKWVPRAIYLGVKQQSLKLTTYFI